MSPAMKELRTFLASWKADTYVLPLGDELAETVSDYLNHLERYVNCTASMSTTQAEELIEDIAQWHTDPEQYRGRDDFLRVATYVNSCR